MGGFLPAALSLECLTGRGQHAGSVDLKGLIMQRWGSAARDGEPFRRHKMALRDSSATFHCVWYPACTRGLCPQNQAEA